jgi:peptidoglycan hydrolase CwlO-like protein
MEDSNTREIMAKLQEIETRIKRLDNKIDQAVQDIQYVKALVMSLPQSQ